ncbi:MAG: anthranilate synthase component I family protein [Myxococcales bacterium]|nr:anthranilate synthase component I family protein [Myxococcales bacterium]
MLLRPWPGADPARIALAFEGPGTVWLDGNGGTPEQRRFSYWAADPVETFRVRWGEPVPWGDLDRLGLEARDGTESANGMRVPRWIGFIAYDAAWSGRAGARLRRPDSDVVWFGRFDAVLVHDAAEGAWYVAADDDAAAERLEARLRRAPASRYPQHARPVIHEPDERAHLAAIDKALDHIARGNVYQVNLARQWTATFDGRALDLALAMRRASPVPFGFLLDTGEMSVVARSMETFLAWDGTTIRTRPIKGTVPSTPQTVEPQAAALRSNDKERAEHAMIVDLMRNDLGRLAQPGTVAVEETMCVEPYAKLSHLVSTVRAETRPDVGVGAILEATFPPGSVTGAPKIRAVELIEALEAAPRGVYTGAFGYVDRAGGLSLAVAIRTAVLRDGEVAYYAGGGIVEASQPASEVEETNLKAAVFFDALASLATDRPSA